MRIVHISTYDVDGGAARAAFRLHESLLAAGQQSTMLVRTRHSYAESVQEIPRAHNSNTFFGDLIQRHYLDQNRTAISTTCFSLGWPGEPLSVHPLVQTADVIHLHWVSGFVAPSTVAGLLALRKPLVWTLHDQRPYTGGCHYTAGCNQFESGCAACPQLVTDPGRLPAANLADQLQALAAGPVTVIAPSQWMAQCARRSALFAGSRIEVIPYGIDTARFRALPPLEARTRLVLPPDNFLMLFGVDNAREKRKGLRELFAVLDSCCKDEDFRRIAAQRKASLLCFGELDSTPELPIPIRSFGRVRSDEVLNLLYSGADLFLFPSLEDNLANTVLESLCCGTPIGAFNSGGTSDLVIQGQTGFLAPTGDLKGLGEILVQAASNPQVLRELRPACRRHVEEHFTYARQAQACLALYEDLLRLAPKPSPEPHRRGSDTATHDPGPNLQRVFAPLLKHTFDLDPALPGPLPASEMDRMRHTKFKRRVKRIVKHAVKRPSRYRALKAALDVELAILDGTSPWPTRLKMLLKRTLGVL